MLITNYSLLFPSFSFVSKCNSTKNTVFSVLRGFYHVLEQLEKKLIGKQVISPLFCHFVASFCFVLVKRGLCFMHPLQFLRNIGLIIWPVVVRFRGIGGSEM